MMKCTTHADLIALGQSWWGSYRPVAVIQTNSIKRLLVGHCCRWAFSHGASANCLFADVRGVEGSNISFGAQ
jgi:prepilin-type processing-associated H-X9-DG protein